MTFAACCTFDDHLHVNSSPHDGGGKDRTNLLSVLESTLNGRRNVCWLRAVWPPTAVSTKRPYSSEQFVYGRLVETADAERFATVARMTEAGHIVRGRGRLPQPCPMPEAGNAVRGRDEPESPDEPESGLTSIWWSLRDTEL